MVMMDHLIFSTPPSLIQKTNRNKPRQQLRRRGFGRISKWLVTIFLAGLGLSCVYGTGVYWALVMYGV
jgi:hypothetical protein